MAPGKRRQKNNISATTPPPGTAETWALPADMLLEIVARTDLFTLVHCAATCKLLRFDILSPTFICPVTERTAPCILAHLRCSHKPLSLVHPAVPAAASFCHDNLSPFILRSAGQELLRSYYPVISRRCLVVLMRRSTRTRPNSMLSSDLCVYDPMTGQRNFLSKPSGILCNDKGTRNYVLLTAADGIGCSFRLLLFHLYKSTMYIQSATSSCCTWGAVATYACHPEDFPWWSVRYNGVPAVIHGGFIHWLAYPGDQALTYDVCTRAMGKVKLPLTNRNLRQLHLVTTSDGNQLKLISLDGFTISVWLQFPTVQTGACHGWSLANVIDIEEKLRSLCPHIPPGGGADVLTTFEGSGQRTGDVVLLHIAKKFFPNVLLVLDLETSEMHTQEWGFTLLEIDLPSRIRAMQRFS